jgi:RimJ/RimL family protein N-acetyltransferase
MENDRGFFVELLTDPDAMQFTGGAMTQERAMRLFDRLLIATRGGEVEAWLVLSKATGRPVGHVALKSDGSDGDREIIVVLSVRQWRKGFAFEISRVVFDYALSTASYPRLIATVDPNHAASVGLAYKSGMTLLEHREDEQGQYPVYAITRQAWLESKG